MGILLHNTLYYIKVSGIASGNKLIKTIQYPHMWRYDIFTCEDIDDFGDIKFVSQIVLKFVGVSSKHLRVFLGSLRQSSEILGHLRKFSEILGKCSGTFVWYSEKFWKIFGNLRKVFGNLRKNHQKRRHQHVYIIKRTLHGGLKIWVLFSRGKNNILLARCARS